MMPKACHQVPGGLLPLVPLIHQHQHDPDQRHNPGGILACHCRHRLLGLRPHNLDHRVPTEISFLAEAIQ